MTAPLPQPIAVLLRQYANRRRWSTLLRAAGQALTVALLWMLAACMTDRMLRFPREIRGGLLLAGLTAVVLLLWRPVTLLLRKEIDWLSAAAGVERKNPVYRQRLVTVVSQLLSRPDHRGSPELLEELVRDVSQQARNDRPRQWSDWRAAAGPWGLAAALLIVLAQLCLIPAVGMPTLLKRFIAPWAAVRPASTTRLEVDPGNISLKLGESQTVRVRAARLDDEPVHLFSSYDGASWSCIPMLPMPDGQYAFTFTAPERDLYYYIQGGDASTAVYRLTVLRPPAVVGYRVRYDYPAYTHRLPITVTNNDGLIEAPVGTKAAVAVICTEPLKSAAITIDGHRLAMSDTDDPRVFQAEFVVQKNQKSDLEMITSGGIPGKLPAALNVRAQIDREPIVRFLQPAEDLRLHPRDLVQISYSAADDFGLSSLSVAMQLNSQPATPLDIQRHGDPRRQEGQCLLDLATLNVKVGDVITLALAAEDGFGHRIRSETRHILISPRSIDIDTHQRIGELKQSAQLASAMRQELIRAGDLLTKIQRGLPQADFLAARMDVSTSLTNAQEAALLMHQSLLRACAKSDWAQQTEFLAECVDHARVLAWRCDRLVATDAMDASESMLARDLAAPRESVRQLASWLRTLADGQQAAAILADRANLRATPASQPTDPLAAERFKETCRRAQQDMAKAVRELRLDPSAGDLDSRLQQLAEAAEQLVRMHRPLDYEAMAAQWTTALRTPDALVPSLVDRLASASAVEAVRPDAEPIIARDLQLASRAASRIAQLTAVHNDQEKQLLSDMLDGLPAAIGALAAEHRLMRQADETRSAEQLESLRQAAVTAREKLLQWGQRGDRPEDLAMEASAQTSRREYDTAEGLDRDLSARVESSPALEGIEIGMVGVKSIDALTEQQRDLRQQTTVVLDELEAMELQQRQRLLADNIGRVNRAGAATPLPIASDFDSRQRAVELVRSAQESLTRMPQQLTRAMELADAYSQALAQTNEARHRAQSATGDSRPPAQRAADQAQRALRQAQDQLTKASASLSAQVADRMAAQLREFEPETQQAVQAVTQQLSPALTVLEQSLTTGDKGAVDRAATRVRASIELTQQRLRDAQARLIESDPLAAARWYAQAAARSLSESPPDVRTAYGYQQNTSVALDHAWRDAVRQTSTQRLAATPQFRAILGPSAQPQNISSTAFSIADLLPGLRQWSNLVPRRIEELYAPLREADPVGYQEPLKVYFEALNKAQQQSQK